MTKLNPAGNGLVFSTYLGGVSSEATHAIVLDATGAAYVIGESDAGFPTTPGALQTVFAGGLTDAIVAKSSGSHGSWTSTRLLLTLPPSGKSLEQRQEVPPQVAEAGAPRLDLQVRHEVERRQACLGNL